MYSFGMVKNNVLAALCEHKDSCVDNAGLVNTLDYESGSDVFLGVGSQSNWSACTPALLHHSSHLQSHLGWPGKINEQIIDEDMDKWAALLLFATQQERWLLKGSHLIFKAWT